MNTALSMKSKTEHAVDGFELQKSMGQDFFEQTRADILALSAPVAELAAALMAVQVYIPKALGDWTLAEMGLRVNLTKVTPVALAAMKIGGVSNFLHTGKPMPDNTPEYALLRALGKEKDLQEAIAFLTRFVNRLVNLAHETQSEATATK